MKIDYKMVLALASLALMSSAAASSACVSTSSGGDGDGPLATTSGTGTAVVAEDDTVGAGTMDGSATAVASIGDGDGDGDGDSTGTDGLDFSMQGWATAGVGTTGGAGGETVMVFTTLEFLDAVHRDDPVVILVSGTLDFENADSSHEALSSSKTIRAKSNKSILGVGSDAEILNGHLSLSNVRNVIVRNIVSAARRRMRSACEAERPTYGSTTTTSRTPTMGWSTSRERQIS